MYLGKADVNTYDKGAGREFLVSNGLGSYGFSTVIGANTRREHGLLVVRPQGETQHTVLVSKIEETVLEGNKKYQLSTNRYKDLVYPDGYRYLQEYQGNPFPVMLFVIHSILLKKSIFMPQGTNCTVLKYELLAAPGKIRLDLRPLFAHRCGSEIISDADKSAFAIADQTAQTLTVSGRGYKSSCGATSGSWVVKPLWFENIIYEQDDTQDSSHVDHLWSPGFVSNELKEGDALYVILSSEPLSFALAELEAMEQEAAGRFENILEQANLPALSSAEQDMIAASYHLIDDRESPLATVYSGYPSAEFKARDTFVALPGLMLATGRESVAERTLKIWSDICAMHNWTMPERIAQDGSHVFEGVDNGLWFVYAADKYLTHVSDTDKHPEIVEAILKVVSRYMEGIEDLDLSCESNMLLKLNSKNPLRHWMDAVAGGEVVVSRTGYLVEVNALWHNALKVAEKYAVGDCATKYADCARKCAESFNEVFSNKTNGGLYDWVSNDKNDDAIRPNQILAVSLPYSPLSGEDATKVVRLCWNELYTTYGLRTLDPRHDKFKGRSEGRADQKLKARFRGMAWPWLLGEFITAYLRHNPGRKDLGWAFVRPFISHLRHGCLGGVAEVFDGMMPYRPHGDVLSAMSLGELLRVLHENLHIAE